MNVIFDARISQIQTRRDAIYRLCWAYCTLLAENQSQTNVSKVYNTSRHGLSLVAYPGQGNARARAWDKREVRATHVFRF